MRSNLLIIAEYYGYRFFLRVEMRRDEDGRQHPTIILSHRDGQIVYEDAPFRFQAWKDTYKGQCTEHGDDTPFPAEQLPADRLRRFFVDCFGVKQNLDAEPPEKRKKSRAEAADRVNRCAAAKLPLAVILAANQDEILHRPGNSGKPRSDGTIADELRAIQKLIELFGSHDWREVIPPRCVDQLHRLSEHQERACVRVMKELSILLCTAGIAEENPWLDYHFRSRNQEKKQSSLAQQAIETVMYPHGQVAAIIAMLGSLFHYAKHRGACLAIFLVLCLRLSLEEICALNYDDFRTLPDFRTRLTVSITHIFAPPPGMARCVYTELDDLTDIRRLELPHLFFVAFQLAEALGNHPGGPLLTDETHPGKRMTPDELKRRISDLLAAFKPAKITDIDQVRLKKPLELLRETADRNLREAGYEDEEMRYILALPPSLVSARNYSDFAFDAAVNKRGAMQDRWLEQYLPVFLAALEPSLREMAETLLPATTDEHASAVLSAKGAAVTIPSIASNQRSRVTLRLRITPKADAELPEGGLTLALGAVRGVSGCVQFLPTRGGDP